MIRKARVFRICLFIILLSSCNILQNDNQSSFTGIFKYDYETDSEDLIEDHYIVLDIVNGKLQGRYYGTSDEFDEVREGYYPGFFVADMKNLKILDNEITFSIEIKESDLFSKSINIKYKTSEEIPVKENPIWVNAHMIEGNKQNPRNYKGRIVGDEILLEVEYGPRAFKRVK